MGNSNFCRYIKLLPVCNSYS